MRQLVQELGRTAFHIVNGMPTPSFLRLNTLRRFERLLLAIQEDRQASHTLQVHKKQAPSGKAGPA